jgi:tetratricopeptide (TPR) repeat protein
VSFLVLAFVLCAPAALAQTKKAAMRRVDPSKAQQSSPEKRALEARARTLELAKEAGDAAGIIRTSRQLVALGQRELAQIKLAQSLPQEAANLYRRSLSFEDAPETHLDLASAYLLSGEVGEALSQATNLVVDNPQDARAWRVQGQVWLLKKNYRQALESLQRSANLQSNPYTFYLLGVALLQEKQREQAGVAFRKALRAGGNRAALHALFSDAYRCANYWDDAARELKQASALDAKISRAHYRLGLLFLARNEWKMTPAARSEFHKEVQFNARDFFGNFARGLTEFFEQHYQQADSFLRMSAAVQPNWPEAWLYLGLAAYNQGDQKSAEESLRKAISLTADDSRGNYQIRRAYYSLGRLVTEQNRKDEAAELVRRFRKIQGQMLLEVQRTPDTMGGGMAQMSPSASAFSALAKVQTEAALLVPASGDRALWVDPASRPSGVSNAERIIAEAQERELRKTIANALNDLGTVEARQEQFEPALSHFREAETWDANTPGLMRNLGLAAARLSDYREAARALRPVVSSNPSDTVARSMLGLALFSTDAYREAADAFALLGDSALERPELAYAWASSLVRINQFGPAAALLEKMEQQKLAPETLILVAQTWSQMGNYPRAVENCHKALEVAPKLHQAHYIAGLALIHQDRPAEASQEFRSELQLQPDDVDTQFHLAFVLLQLSQTEEAVQWLRRVLARNPEHPEANYELGKLMVSEGKPAEAIPFLEAAARLRPQFEPVHYQLQSAYRAAGRKEDADREAKIYKELKAKNRNITLPPPRQESREVSQPNRP